MLWYKNRGEEKLNNLNNLNSVEVSILNYENRLLADRKQLNDLIYECRNQNVNSPILDDKIRYLQTEIDYMNHQLNMLKAEMQRQPQRVMLQSQAPYMQQRVMPQPQVPYMQPQNKAAKPKDLENMIGKSWMGIFASVLIFISFILFATLLAPFITDTIKMTAMYVVSILLTTFGLLRLRKHNNKLYLAISSCGIGAVYISLFLTNLYFKAIGDIALYLFILVWTVFVCYLSKWQDRIFQIIGQCGITIALFFGIILCMKESDHTKLFLLSLFFVVTASIFYVSNYSREFHKNVINNTFNCMNVLQIWVGAYLMRPAAFSWKKVAEAKGYALDWTAYLTEIIAGVVLLFLVLQFVFFLSVDRNAGFSGRMDSCGRRRKFGLL